VTNHETGLLANGSWPPKPDKNLAIQLSVNRTAICEFFKFFDTPETIADKNVYDPNRLEMQTNLTLWQYTEKEHNVISKEDVLHMHP